MYATTKTRSFFKGGSVVSLLSDRYTSEGAANLAAVKLCQKSCYLDAGEVGRPIYQVVKVKS